MPNYQNGKIYKIICDENDLVYYGSTTVPLWQRIGKHRTDYKLYLQNKRKYISSCIEILKYKTHKIVLVEDFSCERREQLVARERFWIENNICVNKYIPYRSKEERKDIRNSHTKVYFQDTKYKESHRKEFREYSKKYREKNLDKIKEVIICECGCQTTRQNLARHIKTQKHINLSLPMGF